MEAFSNLLGELLLGTIHYRYKLIPTNQYIFFFYIIICDNFFKQNCWYCWSYCYLSAGSCKDSFTEFICFFVSTAFVWNFNYQFKCCFRRNITAGATKTTLHYNFAKTTTSGLWCYIYMYLFNPVQCLYTYITYIYVPLSNLIV